MEEKVMHKMTWKTVSSSLENRLLRAVYIPKQAVAEKFLLGNYQSSPWYLSKTWVLVSCFFLKLALSEVTVGSEVKWGPWSASNNLFSDLKKIIHFCAHFRNVLQ